MMVVTKKVIVEEILPRMKDIQQLLVLYIHGRLDLNERQEQTMNSLLKDFCKEWGLPAEHKDTEFRKGLEVMVRRAIRNTKKLIRQKQEVNVAYALALADLESCAHDLLKLKKKK